MNRVLDRLELLIEAQRRSQIVQREVVETYVERPSRSTKSSARRADRAALELVRTNQRNLAEKISNIEVFHLRFDKVLADFDKRIQG